MRTSQNNSKQKSHRPARTRHSFSKNLVNSWHGCIHRNKTQNGSNPHRWSHPDIRKYLKISKSNQFGRFIKAAKSIEVGETVIVTMPFATVVQNIKSIPYCLTCHAVDVKLISCKNCSVVWFCNSKCRNANLTHQYECGTRFHQIKKLDEKCAIQIVLEAMTAFNNFQDLSHFIERAFENQDGVPRGSDTKASRLDCIIKLQAGQFKSDEEKNADNKIAQHAYRMITEFPKVREFFQLDSSNEGRSILIKLLRHSVPAIVENSFRIGLLTKNRGELDRILLYDILSYLNHSCSPNLINIVDGNVMTCTTSQRIRRGEQMFISYIPFETQTLKSRRRELKGWNFICQCDRCEYHREINRMEYKRAYKMSLQQIERKLNCPYYWTPQKGAYIIRYRRLISD